MVRINFLVFKVISRERDSNDFSIKGDRFSEFYR